jgi:manganese transport protein
LVPLLVVARRRSVMGALANPNWLTAVAGALAAMIIALNVFLLQQVFFG